MDQEQLLARLETLESRVADLMGQLERAQRQPWTQMSARHFQLVDENDQVRGEWRLLAGEREPRLALYGEGNKPRIVISVTATGEPVLGLVDNQGKSRVTLTTRGESTLLSLRDRQGQTQLELEVGDQGGTVRFGGPGHGTRS